MNDLAKVKEMYPIFHERFCYYTVLTFEEYEQYYHHSPVEEYRGPLTASLAKDVADWFISSPEENFKCVYYYRETLEYIIGYRMEEFEGGSIFRYMRETDTYGEFDVNPHFEDFVRHAILKYINYAPDDLFKAFEKAKPKMVQDYIENPSRYDRDSVIYVFKNYFSETYNRIGRPWDQ